MLFAGVKVSAMAGDDHELVGPFGRPQHEYCTGESLPRVDTAPQWIVLRFSGSFQLIFTVMLVELG